MQTTAAELRGLHALFTAFFNDFELRSFIRSFYGEVLTQGLPGEGANMDTLAWEAALLLTRHGVVNSMFWDELRRARPSRTSEIEMTARLFANNHPAARRTVGASMGDSLVRLRIGKPVKAAPLFVIFRPFGARYEFRPQSRFAAGDRILVEAQANCDVYCVIFHLTPDTQQAVRVFPSSESNADPQLLAGRPIVVADGVATPPSGRKRFQMLWSRSNSALADAFAVGVDEQIDWSDLRLRSLLPLMDNGANDTMSLYIHEESYEVV